METGYGFDAAQVRDTTGGRRAMVALLEERAREEDEALRLGGARRSRCYNSTLQRGWYWGSQRFRELLLERLGANQKKRGRTGNQPQLRNQRPGEGRPTSGSAGTGANGNAEAWVKGLGID